MRIATYVTLALPALAAAQEQFPFADKLKGWYDQAQGYVKAAGAAAASAVPEAAAGAAKVAEKNVQPLTFDTWPDIIKPTTSTKADTTPDVWMVYMSGGNKTCLNRCGKADRAWHEAVALFARDKTAPKLASIDCESQELLCGIWGNSVPSIWAFQVPHAAPDQSRAPVTITQHPLNATSVTTADVVNIHTRKLYQSTAPYTGFLHPFDGVVAKYGLTAPLAYALFYLAKIPSWAMMLGVSLFSRNFMGRRAANQGPRGQQPRRA